MDLPPIEELRILVAWFKKWYGDPWCHRLEKDAGFSEGYIYPRLNGDTKISRTTLNRLRDVRASLLINAAA